VTPAERARRRLVDDTARTVGFMNSVLADARRTGAPIPEQVAVSVHVWRIWADRLQAWSSQQEGAPE
jgi:hypothetical protein